MNYSEEIKNNISVIVQGPVVGKSSDPYEKRITLQVLENIYKCFPKAEVILSTWENDDIEGLPFNLLIINDDPGGFPNRLEPVINKGNVNRQIVSSVNGLKRAAKKYALKIRTDFILENNDFIEYFGKFQDRSDEWKILEERVIITSLSTRNPAKMKLLQPILFFPSDFVFFGLTKDVLNIWDIPLQSKEEMVEWFIHNKIPEDCLYANPNTLSRYFAEQYIWVSFLKKHSNFELEHCYVYSKELLQTSEKTIANNLIILDHGKQFKLKWNSKIFGYLASKMFYTHKEWLALYYKYCSKDSGKKPKYRANSLNPVSELFYTCCYLITKPKKPAYIIKILLNKLKNS
jgi:hypothetical protein